MSLSRDNRQYTGQLTVNLKPNAPTALTMQNQITADLTKSGLIGGDVSLTAGGGRFSQTSLAASLASTGLLTFLLALFLAYLVMAAQFNSWRYPIYLLLPVPLALIGALWLVFLLGGGLDIFGLMGMLMLIGLSAKNAILYLDFVVERIGKMPFKDALIEAAQIALPTYRHDDPYGSRHQLPADSQQRSGIRVRTEDGCRDVRAGYSSPRSSPSLSYPPPSISSSGTGSRRSSSRRRSRPIRWRPRPPRTDLRDESMR